MMPPLRMCRGPAMCSVRGRNLAIATSGSSLDQLLLSRRPAGLSAPRPQQWLNGIRSWKASPATARVLLPLDGAWWFRGDVVRHAVHTRNLADDALRDQIEDVVREPGPVGGHGILGRHDPDDDGVLVRPTITHHADRVDIAENDAERLPGLTLETGTTYLVADDGVGGPNLVCALQRHLAHDPDGQPRPREGLPLHDLFRHAQLLADLPNLVLEQVAEGFDDA